MWLQESDMTVVTWHACKRLNNKGHSPWRDLIDHSSVAQTVKHLPAMWEIQVWSLDQEDPLEKEMATHSSTLAWRIPWTEEPGGLQSMESQRVRHDWATEHAHNNVLGNLLETDRDRKPKQTEGVLAFIETEHSPETIYVCSCSNTKCKNLWSVYYFWVTILETSKWK